MTPIFHILGVKDRVGTSRFCMTIAEHWKKEGKRVAVVDGNLEHPGDLQLLSEGHPLQKNILSQMPQKEEDWDVIVVDLGSRFRADTAEALRKTSGLIFVMNADVTLTREAERKLAKLRLSYFPMKKVGWIAWHWDVNSFMTVPAVTDFLKIPCLGSETTQIGEAIWRCINGSLLDSAYLPENLLELSVQTKRGNSTLSISSDVSLQAVAKPSSQNHRLKENLLAKIQKEMEEVGLKNSEEKHLGQKVGQIIADILEKERGNLPDDLNRTQFVRELLDEILGLGPLETLLGQEGLGEILVNGLEPIWIEKGGRLQQTEGNFINESSLYRVIERILLPLGRRVDEASPMVDARLKDGSRVNIIIPPLALNGPVISIRRFSNTAMTPNRLIEYGSCNEKMIHYLSEAVKNEDNILVSGGTGSGKTTLLNLLSSFISGEERIITIEDAAELKLNQPHVVRLESRPANIEGEGGVTIRDLVRNALRMRPDRIVVGECRGAEALDMLSAMNTGHDGSLTTLHANTPRDAMRRLETLVMFAGMDLPSKAIREQIASAVDLVVQINRLSDGSRKITSITRVIGLEGDTFTLQDVFTYENGNFTEQFI